MDFFFQCPTFAQFGEGKADMVGELVASLGFQKVMLIYDQGVKAAGITDNVLKNLKVAGLGVLEYSDVKANPPDTQVEEASAKAKAFGAQCIVAVGGGSSMDCAKAVNILQTNPSPINQYDGLNLIKNPVPPMIAIPTTAGTASEVSGACVVTDTVRMKKMVMLGANVPAAFALVDPLLTMGLPPALTAATGMDALTHGIESYVSKWASPPSRAMAGLAIGLVYNNIVKAYKDGSDKEARTNMMLGSMVAGYAFSNTDLGIVHCIAHPLSVHCGLAHGVANACGLPYGMEYNAEVVPEIMKEVAIAMGLDVAGKTPEAASAEAVEAVKALSKDLEIPSLKDLGVSRDILNKIAEDALKESGVTTNPRDMTKEDVLSLLDKMY